MWIYFATAQNLFGLHCVGASRIGPVISLHWTTIILYDVRNIAIGDDKPANKCTLDPLGIDLREIILC